MVPYRAEPQMLTDLVGGQLDVACTLTTSPGPHVLAGRLRALAVTSATRTQQLPDADRAAGGLPGFEAIAWFALAAPGTPPQIVEKINAAVNVPAQRQGPRGFAQARSAAGRRHAGGNQGLHRRREPQMGADHQGGGDSDVTAVVMPAQAGIQ